MLGWSFRQVLRSHADKQDPRLNFVAKAREAQDFAVAQLKKGFGSGS